MTEQELLEKLDKIKVYISKEPITKEDIYLIDEYLNTILTIWEY